MLLGFHVLISLVAIVAGFVFLRGLLLGREAASGFFLLTTLATSLSGFLLPFQQILPSHILGAISVALLSLALWARYAGHLQGGWRRAYVVSSLISFSFNLLVLFVQTFKRLPHPLNLAEPLAQLVLLVWMVWVALRAERSFRNAPTPPLALGL